MIYLTESEGMEVLFGQDVHGPIHPDLKSNAGDYQRFLRFRHVFDHHSYTSFIDSSLPKAFYHRDLRL
jgi:hypothetical protein